MRIPLKMTDKRRSDSNADFTVILEGAQHLCLVRYEANIHRLVSNGFSKYLPLI